MSGYILPALLAAAWLWALSGRRSGTFAPSRAGFALLAAFTLFSWLPAAWLGALTLEAAYPLASRPPASAQAIVVLAGQIRYAFPAPVDPLPGPGTALRCHHAAWLYQNGFDLPIFVSGGPVGSGKRAPVAADVMKSALVGLGVPASRVFTESRSANTHENAVESAQILRKAGFERILLVTEAFHMRRASAAFRKQGIDVVPAPCGFRREQFGYYRWYQWVPTPQAILWNEEHFREWAAFAAYWLRDWL
ncbi:MAG: YdcF family protein [Bryobacteraceae bacterium]